MQRFMGGEYTVKLLGRTADTDVRVVEITTPDGVAGRYRIAAATSDGCDCMIDTLRITLLADHSAARPGYLPKVRKDLVGLFPNGPMRVRWNDYLEFPGHVAETIRGLARHALDPVPDWRPDDFKIVCVDLDNPADSTVFGSGAEVHFIARENRNHFVPLAKIEQLVAEVDLTVEEETEPGLIAEGTDDGNGDAPGGIEDLPVAGTQAGS